MIAYIKGLLGLTLLLAAGALAAQEPAPTVASSPVSLSEGYVLGTGDVIEVTVLGRDDYKPRTQVQADGSIALPLVGSVPAKDKTILALREDIKRRLISGGFFARPEINIFVVTFAGRNVTVLGEVATPGVVAVDREYRLSEIVARAGGVRTAGADVVTLTTAAGAATEYSLQAIATGGGPTDPIVSPGDKVFVAPAKTFYIYGQVSAPGTYAIDPGLTVRRALARAGGLTALGSEKRIKLFRGEQETKKVKIDEKVLPGDTIVVGERFF